MPRVRMISVPLQDQRSLSEKGEELFSFLERKLKHVQDARFTQVEQNYDRWDKIYNAIPFEVVRTFPWPHASNFIVPLARIMQDVMIARHLGLIWATRPLWTCLTVGESKEIEAWRQDAQWWLDFQARYVLQLFDPVRRIMNRTGKAGTCIHRAIFVYEDKYEMRYEGDKEVEKLISCDRFELHPIEFYDFWVYPATVPCLQQAEIKFQRFRYTEEALRAKGQTGAFDTDAVDTLIKNRQEQENRAQQSKQQQTGVKPPSVEQPFEVFEVHLKYPVTNDRAKEFEIVVWFNPSIRRFFRAVYRYNSVDEFEDWRFFPRDGSFWGMGTPERLELAQEEASQIHNRRIDANTITSIPGWKQRRYAEVPNPSSEWYPGKVFLLDDMADLEPLQFNRSYNAMIEEEMQVFQLAERDTGISPPMQGFGAGSMQGRRGVYSAMGTLALLSEGNRRINVQLHDIRGPFGRLGRQIYAMYHQHSVPEQLFWQPGVRSENLKAAFKVSPPEGVEAMFFELAASDAAVNKETERQSLMLAVQVLSQYYGVLMQMTQVVLSSKNPLFIQVSLQIVESARLLAQRILTAFDIYDRSNFLPDLMRIIQEAQNGGDQPGGPTSPQGAVQPGFDIAAVSQLEESLAQSASAGQHALEQMVEA